MTRVLKNLCKKLSARQGDLMADLLFSCYRSQEVWEMVKNMGLEINIHMKSIIYGIFDEKVDNKKHEFLWFVIAIVKSKLWKTRCRMTIDQQFVSSENVFKQIKTELKRLRTLNTPFKDTDLYKYSLTHFKQISLTNTSRYNHTYIFSIIHTFVNP